MCWEIEETLFKSRLIVDDAHDAAMRERQETRPGQSVYFVVSVSRRNNGRPNQFLPCRFSCNITTIKMRRRYASFTTCVKGACLQSYRDGLAGEVGAVEDAYCKERAPPNFAASCFGLTARHAAGGEAVGF